VPAEPQPFTLMPEPKVCDQCQERPALAKGLCSRCYQAKRRKEEPELVRAIRQAWDKSHLEQRNAYRRTYLAEQRGGLCQQCRERPAAWAKGLCERCYQAKRYREQPETKRARHRAWEKSHREQRNAYRRVYLAEQRGGLCQQCQERPVCAKGLCSRCYQACWRKEHPEMDRARKRAAYARHREEALGKTRALHEPHQQEQSA